MVVLNRNIFVATGTLPVRRGTSISALKFLPSHDRDVERHI